MKRVYFICITNASKRVSLIVQNRSNKSNHDMTKETSHSVQGIPYSFMHARTPFHNLAPNLLPSFGQVVQILSGLEADS